MKSYSQFMEDAGSGRSKQYEDERLKRKYNKPEGQLNKERKLAYMLNKDLPPPLYKSRSLF